jgi:transcriptional regulator with XRE-family HTH domain
MKTTTQTPDYMTGAELQTLREAAGLSREALAELAQVQARTVKHWEIRTGSAVPADVAAMVQAAACWVMETARDGLRQILEAHKPPADVVLIRYRETGHMQADHRAQGLRSDVHGAMVSRLVLDLLAHGLRVRVVWFDPQSYADWLAQEVDKPDGGGARIDWAKHAIADQATPHAGDQPPAVHTPRV